MCVGWYKEGLPVLLPVVHAVTGGALALVQLEHQPADQPVLLSQSLLTPLNQPAQQLCLAPADMVRWALNR